MKPTDLLRYVEKSTYSNKQMYTLPLEYHSVCRCYLYTYFCHNDISQMYYVLNSENTFHILHYKYGSLLKTVQKKI